MKPFPWQARFRRGIARKGVRIAGLSVSRSNGKSFLVADLAKDYLLGDRHDSECLLVASEFKQSKIILRYLFGMLRAEGHDLDDRKRWVFRDSMNSGMIRDRDTGITVRAMSGKPSGLFGRVFGLCLLDEPREHGPGVRDELLVAVTSGMGKVDGAQAIALGSSPASPDHWFSRWLDGEADYAQLHAARPEDPPFQLRTIRKANPSFDHLPALRVDLLARREKARRFPDELNEYLSRHLNRGVADIHEPLLVEPDDWQGIEVDILPAREGPCVWGVDIGFSEAFSAIVSHHPLTGRTEALLTCGGIPSIQDRSRRDQCPGSTYQNMVTAGDLLVQDGRRVPDLSIFIEQALNRLGTPSVIVADHFRRPELADALDSSPMPRGRDFVTRRMRWSEASEDIRRTRKMILERKMSVSKSVAWRYSLAESRVVYDDQGSCRLAVRAQAGRRARARTDLASALVLCLAEADRRGVPEATGHRLRLVAV